MLLCITYSNTRIHTPTHITSIGGGIGSGIGGGGGIGHDIGGDIGGGGIGGGIRGGIGEGGGRHRCVGISGGLASGRDRSPRTPSPHLASLSRVQLPRLTQAVPPRPRRLAAPLSALVR